MATTTPTKRTPASIKAAAAGLAILTGTLPSRWAPAVRQTAHAIYERARELRPGQWYLRPPVAQQGHDGAYTPVSVVRICAGVNRWMRRRAVRAAAFATEDGGELRVVIAWAEEPGEPDTVPFGDEALAKAIAEWAPGTTRTAAEKAAEREVIGRKLSGRGPVPGFDGGEVKLGRAKRVSSTEGDE